MADTFIRNFGESIGKAAQKAAEQTAGFIDAAKISGQISGEQKKISELYRKLGEAVFQRCGIFSDLLTEEEKKIADDIMMSLNVVDELKEALAEAKGMKLCLSCRQMISLDVCYCPKCGAAAPVPERKKAAADDEDLEEIVGEAVEDDEPIEEVVAEAVEDDEPIEEAAAEAVGDDENVKEAAAEADEQVQEEPLDEVLAEAVEDEETVNSESEEENPDDASPSAAEDEKSKAGEEDRDDGVTADGETDTDSKESAKKAVDEAFNKVGRLRLISPESLKSRLRI